MLAAIDDVRRRRRCRGRRRAERRGAVRPDARPARRRLHARARASCAASPSIPGGRDVERGAPHAHAVARRHARSSSCRPARRSSRDGDRLGAGRRRPSSTATAVPSDATRQVSVISTVSTSTVSRRRVVRRRCGRAASDLLRRRRGPRYVAEHDVGALARRGSAEFGAGGEEPLAAGRVRRAGAGHRELARRVREAGALVGDRVAGLVGVECAAALDDVDAVGSARKIVVSS